MAGEEDYGEEGGGGDYEEEGDEYEEEGNRRGTFFNFCANCQFV